MTATEELRRMLDERGADYRVSATGYSIDIGPYTTAYANRSDTTLDVSLRQVTPEQAIDATLGRGACEVVYCEDAYGTDGWYCNGCGEWFAATFRHTRHNNLVSPHFCPNCGAKVVDDAKDDG